MPIRDVLAKLVERTDLTEREMESCMDEVVSGQVAPSQVGSFLSLLKVKGETAAELTGAAKSLRRHMIRVTLDHDVVLDTCGTGGDQSGSFNVSTISAFVLAAGGVKVAKHGNRAASSKCGSADLLELLGARIDLSPERVKACIERTNLGFLFAPSFHPVLKNVAGVRKELPFRTIFNCIGPLANPACANYQTVGVPSRSLLPRMADSIASLGVRAAMVFHNSLGLDELFLSDNHVFTVDNGSVIESLLTPQDVGLKQGSPEQIRCEDAAQNKQIALDVFNGKAGVPFDTVILNAAAGFVTTKQCRDFREAVDLARSILSGGRARQKLNEFIEFTNA
jgi:anthranilate phosphoribosyltransferase